MGDSPATLVNTWTSGRRLQRDSLKLRRIAPDVFTMRLRGQLFLVLAALWWAPLAARIVPGEVWLDAEGDPVNAHGGSILYHEGSYYWYGQIMAGPTTLPEANLSWRGTRVEVEGIACYRSRDLLHWRAQGNVLPAVTDDPAHDLHPSRVVERPKVVYNRATGWFVMWLHLDAPDYSEARLGVAISRRPTGPFEFRGGFRPHAGIWPENIGYNERRTRGPDLEPFQRDFREGQMARDFTVFVDDDEKAYLFYSSEDNRTLHLAELTSDYTGLSGRYRRIFVDRRVEAPVVFKRQGKYYLIASALTGWRPSAARSAVAPTIWGPWTFLGNPCRGPDEHITFGAQGAFALKVADRDDAYVFIADRWNIEDLPDSRYLWLPLEFGHDGRPLIRWADAWDPRSYWGD